MAIGLGTGNKFLRAPLATSATSPGTFYIYGSAGLTGGGHGGALTLAAGSAAGDTKNGGNLTILGGDGGAGVSGGGSLYLKGGSGSNGAGILTLDGGDSGRSNTAGGHVYISGGINNHASPAGSIGGGSIIFRTSRPLTASVLEERFRISNYGAWSLGDATNNFGSSGQVLTSNGTTAPPSWTTPASGTVLESNITDGTILARVASNETISGIWTFTGAPVFSALSTFNGGAAFTTTVTGVDPSAGTDLATKQYVDAVAAGLNVHEAVRVATTGNITLSGTQTIDSVAVTIGDRVLVKNQSTASANGVYVVASGAWTRSSDFDGSPVNEVASGDFIYVREGTTQGGEGWVLITSGTITIGTTGLTFSQMTSPANGVTSVNVSGGSTGLSFSGGPITTSGTITAAGTLALASGGTGATTQQGAANAVLPSQTSNSGKFLTTDGTNASWGSAAVTNANNTFTKAQRGAVVALTPGATVNTDLSLSNNFSLAPTSNFTMAFPTNVVPGQSGIIVITQDATGSRVVSWAAGWVAAGGVKPVLSTAANSVDYISYYVETSSRVYITASLAVA